MSLREAINSSRWTANLFGPRQLGFGILGVTADEEVTSVAVT